MKYDLSLLEILFENLQVPCYVLDTDGNTLYANAATFQMYNCSPEFYQQYYSNSYAMTEAGCFGEKREAAFFHVLREKRAVSLWHEIVDVNGKSHLYYVSQQPIMDNGELLYIIGICQSYDDIKRIYSDSMHNLDPMISSRLISGRYNEPLFISEEMRQVVNMANRIAKTPANVLLLGETGAGKDVIANYIHQHSQRAGHDMIAVNCAAVPASVFESEMFGYSPGAFTGASAKGKPGLIELAKDSTLFLDEIDSLPYEQQGKLLRVIESKLVRRIGENRPSKVDFRLIAATNKDLLSLVNSGSFREDLYYRLNTISLKIPPLRQRKADISCLADSFLQAACAEYNTKVTLSPGAYAQLESYSWPGNVRELKQIIERTVLMQGTTFATSTVDRFDFESDASPSGSSPVKQIAEPMPETLESRMNHYEMELIRDALERYGTPTQVAKMLGVSLPTISRKMAKYGLSK